MLGFIGIFLLLLLQLPQSVVLGQTPAPATVFWTPTILDILPPSAVVPRSTTPTIIPTESPITVPIPTDTIPPTVSPIVGTPAPVVAAPVPPATAVPVPISATTLPPSTGAPVIENVTSVPKPTLEPFIETPFEGTTVGIYLVYTNISHNTFGNDTEFQIADITTAWFLDFFKSIVDISNVTTRINITESGQVADTNDTYILYEQTLEYVQVNAEALDPENYTLFPFNNESAVDVYISALQITIPDVFSELSRIETPVIGGTPPKLLNTTEAPPDVVEKDDDDNDDGGGLGGGVIAVIVVVALGGIGLLFYTIYKVSNREGPRAYTSTYEPSVIKSIDGTARSIVQRIEPGLFVVYAPAGKLGFSLDHPDSGPLVLYNVKDDSPLHDQIQKGDRLVRVDDLDVTGSSPSRVIDTLQERSANPYRKLTFIRHDELQTINDLEGQYVVYAPPEKLGFSLQKSDGDEPPTVRALNPTSLFVNTVEVGDQLLSIDEVDTNTLSTQECVKVLKDRSTNPFRKLTFLRVMTSESLSKRSIDNTASTDIQSLQTTGRSFIVYAPAGKLGFSLDKPDSGPLVIFIVKDDSPFRDQIQKGDRLVGVDEMDVRESSPSNVIGLLKERAQNPSRKLIFVRHDE